MHPDRIDFHRESFVLFPECKKGEKPHETFLIAEKFKKPRVFCSCSNGKYAKCEEAREILAIYNYYKESVNGESPYDLFLKSFILRLLNNVIRFQANSVELIKFTDVTVGEPLRITGTAGESLAVYYSNGADRQRFISRISTAKLSRYSLMNKAVTFLETSQEREMAKAGVKTQRQKDEGSFWYRLAYHIYREFDENSVNTEFCVNSDGKPYLRLFANGNELADLIIPSKAVQSVLTFLQKEKPLALSKFNIIQNRELLFTVCKEQSGNVAIKPVVKPESNESEVYEIDERFIYGGVVCLPESSVLCFMSGSSVKLLATGWGNKKLISFGEFSSFLEKNESAFSIGNNNAETESEVINLFSDIGANDYKRIAAPLLITEFSRIELKPLNVENESTNREKYVLEVIYCAEKYSVLLSSINEAQNNHKRFLFDGNAIFDLKSKGISSSLVSARNVSRPGTITLSRSALLQFRNTTISTKIIGEESLAVKIRQMLEFRPHKELQAVTGLTCTLRDYQVKGVQWLLFLYDNSFGGLLCDDMGLGKTIQIISFLAAIKEQRDKNATFCIVAPTSVMSHWERLCQMFAPSLNVQTYYSSTRKSILDQPYDILLTTYGILRNDSAILSNVRFDVAVYDEVHNLKNKDTVGYLCAVDIDAKVKIGLTGTPIENSLSDLRSLLDLTLPGLFENEFPDDEQFLIDLERGSDSLQKKRLHRLTSPFILRRLKETVLDELPQKIEDLHYCTLSSYQDELYQRAALEVGSNLVETLKNEDKPIPYMHIFALFSYLKQVCNHPALALKTDSDYNKYECGKWELFKELLEESLNSGAKVVVFTQYLGMIKIMEKYCESIQVGCVSLTGATKNRGRIIQKFAEDSGCRVFLGSLKAGGVGIDLVAASVVIHYDRWWNSAKEDQATDRVHRIGQTRGVQVFKLITKKTIEERIASIIDRKKNLVENALVEDSPDTLKVFSRKELLELLTM